MVGKPSRRCGGAFGEGLGDEFEALFDESAVAAYIRAGVEEVAGPRVWRGPRSIGRACRPASRLGGECAFREEMIRLIKRKIRK